MKTHLTELTFILDRSGSMNHLVEAAIQGFNHFLREHQTASGLARLTLVLFDDEYLVPAQSLPIAEVVPLDARTYVPRNSTALLDAIGRSIDELGARLAATPEPDRPAKVIMAILTDGLENASTQYTWKDIASRIKHQTEVYKWDFLFLGANQDAIATAAQINIAADNAATFRADLHGLRSSGSTLARKSRGLRTTSQGTATPEEFSASAAPLSEILKEEDSKSREQT
jgi:hypothetical protein